MNDRVENVDIRFKHISEIIIVGDVNGIVTHGTHRSDVEAMQGGQGGDGFNVLQSFISSVLLFSIGLG